MDSSTYRPGAVLVTGGCGFIASNVLNWMVRRRPDVRFVNLDRMDYCASLHNILPEVASAANYAFVQGDVGDAELVGRLLREHRIDTVMHFAAQSHVCNSFESALQFTRDNMLATHVLLECMRSYGAVRKAVIVSTDEVYGSVTDGVARKEDAPFAPTSPYAASKAAADLMAHAYATSYGMPIVITRSSNVYGPNQFPEKVVPRFIEQLRDGRPCTLHGGGTTRRMLLHVDDAVRAFDVVLDRVPCGTAVNIAAAAEDELVMSDLARRLIALVRPGEPTERWLQTVADRPFNDVRYFIDSTLLRSYGWSTRVSVDQGLRDTVAWYAAHPNHWSDTDEPKRSV
ncbi:6-dehydratase [uncultured virus]|nr:6-dehydratase [uncultured virus]